MKSPFVVVVPLDVRRPLRLHTVAETQHKVVLELVARQCVDPHVAAPIEVGRAMLGQQYPVNVSRVAVCRLVVESPVKIVVQGWDTALS